MENVFQEIDWINVIYILIKKILIANDKFRYYNYKWVMIIQNLPTKEKEKREFFLRFFVNYLTIKGYLWYRLGIIRRRFYGN